MAVLLNGIKMKTLKIIKERINLYRKKLKLDSVTEAAELLLPLGFELWYFSFDFSDWKDFVETRAKSVKRKIIINEKKIFHKVQFSVVIIIIIIIIGFRFDLFCNAVVTLSGLKLICTPDMNLLFIHK